jgi:universal stress protein E
MPLAMPAQELAYMRTIRRILVAVKNPEARTIPALAKAAQLARGLDARLELFHAMTWPIYATADLDFHEIEMQERDRVTTRLQKLAARVAGSGRQRRLRISVAAEWDRPAYEAIIRRATATGADLIVADQHPGPHFSPLLRFSDWELLRHSPIPVLLIKRGGAYRRPVVLAAVDPGHFMDKPARLDTAILDIGAEVTRGLGGQLHTVHSSEALLGTPAPMDASIPMRPLDPETAAALNRKLAATARRRYERLLRNHKIAASRRHLLTIAPADAIELVAARTHSAIVVLGAVSRSGWSRLLIGNTAETVLDPLRCDLLVVKPPRFKSAVPKAATGARYRAAIAFAP